MKNIIRFSIIIGFILLVTLLSRLNYKEVWKVVNNANIWLIVIGSIFIPIEILLRTLKLQSLINSHSHYSLLDSLDTYLISTTYGAITPGKVGSMVKVYLIKQKTNLKKEDCLAIGVADQFLDMLSLILLAVIGLLIIILQKREGHNLSTLIVALVFSVVLFAMIILLINREVVRNISRFLFKRFIPTKHLLFLKSIFDNFYNGLNYILYSGRYLTQSILLAFLSWSSASIRALFYAKAMGIYQISWYYFIFIIPAIIIVELLPLSIMGIGTREYSIVLLFSIFDVSPERAISLSILTFVLGPVIPTLVGYVLALKTHISLKNISVNNNNETNNKNIH